MIFIHLFLTVYLIRYHTKILKKYLYFRKKWHLFGLDIGKISICGDKMESWCHLEMRVFFSSWKRWFFEEFWLFTTRENGASIHICVVPLGRSNRMTVQTTAKRFILSVWPTRPSEVGSRIRWIPRNRAGRWPGSVFDLQASMGCNHEWCATRAKANTVGVATSPNRERRSS